jgi:hypothetical protein
VEQTFGVPQRATPGRSPFIGAFESTYLPGHRVDVVEATGHDVHWRADLDAVLGARVHRLRYPLRWHRIEAESGRFDWSATDLVLGYLRDRGADAIVDLVHHTSYPEWLTDGFRDRRFGPAFLRYAEAVADRYPWLSSYTLFNEPFATLFLAGHEALWPPYDRGPEGLARLLGNVLPAICTAARCWSELLPDAEHVWVDTCEHHAGTPGGPADHAALANDRRHVVLDLALHHDFVSWCVQVASRCCSCPGFRSTCWDWTITATRSGGTTWPAATHHHRTRWGSPGWPSSTERGTACRCC